jgi:hypothetical protein
MKKIMAVALTALTAGTAMAARANHAMTQAEFRQVLRERDQAWAQAAQQAQEDEWKQEGAEAWQTRRQTDHLMFECAVSRTDACPLIKNEADKANKDWEREQKALRSELYEVNRATKLHGSDWRFDDYIRKLEGHFTQHVDIVEAMRERWRKEWLKKPRAETAHSDPNNASFFSEDTPAQKKADRDLTASD